MKTDLQKQKRVLSNGNFRITKRFISKQMQKAIKKILSVLLFHTTEADYAK